MFEEIQPSFGVAKLRLEAAIGKLLILSTTKTELAQAAALNMMDRYEKTKSTWEASVDEANGVLEFTRRRRIEATISDAD